MIDFHTHILPNVDDGSKSIDETFELLNEAKNAGFDTIISTSHYIEDYYDGDLTSDGLTITRSVLRSYDLDVSLVDNKGRACSGYVIASRTHGIDSYQAYLSCPNYTTNDYEDWRS